ncbi:MAG: hypothetical protein JWO51_4231 [Rhodospirillales bacterium]|nr:hypothetical protein [Rhodospirillales bacterium]
MTAPALTMIYGTGAGAERFLARASDLGEIHFVSTNGGGTFRGQDILPAQALRGFPTAQIVVVSSYRRQIIETLADLGIEEHRVRWYLAEDDRLATTDDIRASFVQHPADYQVLMAEQDLMANFKDLDPAFFPLVEPVKPFTMTSIPRLHDLFKTVEYLVKASVPGDMLECGVWRGGSMMMVAKTLVAMGDTSRRLYLYDTYAGHPKPDADKDVCLWGNRAVDAWITYSKTDGTSEWAAVSVEEVRDNMASTGYPMDKVTLVKGKVEDTAPVTFPDTVALVRLDTDWYESTRVALDVFWPRLSRRGVLIADDYGHYLGQREAIDRYFADNPVLLHRIDYSCRSIVKVD